jgi:hypothetical protein
MTHSDINERIYDLTENGFMNSEELKPLITQGTVGVAQINPTACDIESNSKKLRNIFVMLRI